ncbi:DsbA family protein [Chitinophaga sp. Cy-1792]|uniref:DsbA family protein n=1 Tax=Chitinophaga sp. Cy-1792 TaxID=2608339 RepID=UPI00141ECBF1|nr:DsbA family protein [Chitinophaga sp. Cy-1792]NIG53664.1 DsbA family protein [Chitinophaga sp. Cy-1792]
MQLIYVYDALCGWCYGFTPVVQQLQERYPDMEFDVLSGGMILGANKRPWSAMHSYIMQAHKSVEETTGVQFGDAFLNELLPSSEKMDSETPGIALTVFKTYQPEKALDFAHDMQVVLNYNGESLSNDDTYRKLVEKYNIPADEFLQKLHDENFRYQTQQEFQMVQNWGITGFPAAILDLGNGGQLYLCAKGYTTLERLQQTIENIIAESKSKQ